MNSEEDEFKRIEAEAKRRAAQQALPDSGKRGSIALARSLCYQINGAADDSDDMDGGGYGSVDIAEILSAEVVRLQAALAQPEQQAELVQEPVAWAVQACSKMWRGEFAEIDAKAEAKRIGGTCVAFALYTTPPPCPTCEALARTVMFDQTSHDTQRTWVGLTDGDWEWVADKKETSLDTFAHGAAWAADQLKERNDG